MATNQSFTDQELQNKFDIITLHENVNFMARHALRMFPLLLMKGLHHSYFHCWEEKQRSEFILALWQANLALFCFNSPFNFHATSGPKARDLAEKQAIDAKSWFLAAPFTATKKAVLVADAIFAMEHMSQGDSHKIKNIKFNVKNSSIEALHTAYQIISLAEIELDFSIPDIKKESLKDLSLLINSDTNSIENSPLWQSPNANFISWLKAEMHNAFTQQKTINQKNSPAGAFHILENIWPIYWSIFNGQVNWKDIERTAEQLIVYFDKDSSEPVQPVTLSNVAPENQSEEAQKTTQTLEGVEKTIAGHRHNSHQAAIEDTLNRKHLAATLASLLANPDNTHHQTIGLLGHWGIGKSTVIELVKQTLIHPQSNEFKKDETHSKSTQHTDFLVAEFNAWEYEHTDNLQAGIAQEMINTLSSPEPETTHWEKIEDDRNIKDKRTLWKTLYWLWRKPILILRFAWRLHGIKILAPLLPLVFSVIPMALTYIFKETFTEINPFSAYIFSSVWFVGFLVPTWKKTKTLLAGPRAKELLTYLKLPDYGQHLGTIPVMRRHIKKLTEVRLKPNQRVLYVVDDLDRCGHEGIVKVLEAVRMVLDLKNVIVVIAVDQRIALAALALHYKDLASQHHIQNPRIIARDYLSKIIHLPIVLTAPDNDSIQSYLDSMWNENAPKGEQESTKQKEDQEDKKELGNEDDSLNTVALDEAENLFLERLEKNSEKIEKTTASEESESIPLSKRQNDPTSLSETQEESEFLGTVILVEQLTNAQKDAFAYWIKYFGLSNPRQIKRLNNSFNFLRNFYDKPVEDIPVEVIGVNELVSKDEGVEHAFPMMVTLFALEYLNNLNDLALRKSLYQALTNEPENAQEEALDPKINALVIELAKLDLSNTTMVKAIEPFVLPGIESIKPIDRS